MICSTCNNNVHPQPHRMSIGCCAKCGAEVAGFKEHDAKYTCACGNTDHVVPRSKFIHRCPLDGCGARMATPDDGDPVSTYVTAEERVVAPRLVKPMAKASLRSAPIDVIGQCRERLAYVKERIAELRAFEKEERQLELMLAVVDADDLAAE